jgi:LysM repeat protein
MAGGGFPPGDDALRHLTARGSARRPGIVVVAVGSSLLLGGCLRESAPPTLVPAPTLAVVTVTPGPPPVPTPGVEQRYLVREGDTLSGIAARFGVPEEAILEANGITDPNRILVGQELVIPPARP